MSIDAFNTAAIEDVPLTAVHVPRDALGEEAVLMLQQRLIRPQAAIGTLLLNGTLDVRESVRRVRPGRGAPACSATACMINARRRRPRSAGCAPVSSRETVCAARHR